MENKSVRMSKFLCLVLRHKPETIGLTLSPEGWANVEELIRKAFDAGVLIDRPMLRQIVEHGDKKRFSFSSDGESIRAEYGHSIPITPVGERSEPPEFLYHGTSRDSYASIMAEGLGPGTRQYVHLVEDEKIAYEVGGRHGEPIVLVVNARKMHEAGFEFYGTASGIWLTKNVPREYLIQGNSPASPGGDAGH